MSLQFYLQKIVKGGVLTEAEAAAANELILQQPMPSAPAVALVTALAARGAAAEEIVGFAQNLRQQTQLQNMAGSAKLTDIHSSAHPAIVLGAALICVAAGAPIAKLAQRAKGGGNNSNHMADLLALLGITTPLTPGLALVTTASTGLGFFTVTDFVAEARAMQALRDQLEIPLLYDTLPTLAHPAQIGNVLLTAATDLQINALAQAVRRLRFTRAVIISSTLPYTCPITTADEIVLAELNHGRVVITNATAAAYGLNFTLSAAEIAATDSLAASAWLKQLLAQKPCAVLPNIIWLAALTLLAAGIATDLPSAVALASTTATSDKPKMIFEAFTTAVNRVDR